MTDGPEDKKNSGKAMPDDPRRAYSIDEAPDEHLEMLEEALAQRLSRKTTERGS